HWLAPIRELYADHRTELDAMSDIESHDRLCELNVLRQVRQVASNPFVTEAWAAGQPLEVHGWCYSIRHGLVTDLDTSISSPEQAAARFG
ncbi:carbonic anhydrase, partial [Mycobacterium tuberculosis]